MIMSIMETMTDIGTIVVLDSHNSHEYEESDEEEGNEISEANE